MTTTVRMSATEIYKDWHIIDAADQPLGRVASEVAKLIVGKHKPTYEPHLDDGDYVIVLNAAKVLVTGRKREQMVYYRHSGYPGGLKSRTYDQQMERFPETVLERAINGMLPKGALGHQMRRHVKIYAGAEHPHHGQIAAMEKSVAERKAAGAEALEKSFSSPKPPPRLRPLAIPQGTVIPEPIVEEKPKKRTAKKKVAEEAVVDEATEAVADTEAEAEEKPKPKRSTAKKEATETAVVTEGETALVEDAPVEEKPKPKKRTAKKKVDADAAEATTEEKPKPKRRAPKKKADAEATTESATETEE